MLEELGLETTSQEAESPKRRRKTAQSPADGLAEVAASSEAAASPKEPKRRAGGRNYKPATPPQLAGILATGFKFSTVVIVDLLDMPKSTVMTSAEAAAFADPASRLLWPHLRHLKMLKKAMDLAEKQSDWVLLFKAMYAYGDRVGMQAFEAYQIKLQQAKLQAAQLRSQGSAQPTARPSRPVSGPVAERPRGPSSNGSTGPVASGLSGDAPTHWGGGPYPASIGEYNPLSGTGFLEPLEAGDLLAHGRDG